MSVQTQIDRISGAVSAALTALAEKGVTVPAGTKVDGLAALIAAIEAGGGSGGEPIAYGTVIPSSDCTKITITHGLGVLPAYGVFFVLNANGNVNLNKASTYAGGKTQYAMSSFFAGNGYAYASKSDKALTQASSYGGTFAFRDLNENSFVMGNDKANVNFYSSYEYIWVVWGEYGKS